MARIQFPVCLSSGSFKGEGAVTIGVYTVLGGTVLGTAYGPRLGASVVVDTCEPSPSEVEE